MMKVLSLFSFLLVLKHTVDLFCNKQLPNDNVITLFFAAIMEAHVSTESTGTDASVPLALQGQTAESVSIQFLLC